MTGRLGECSVNDGAESRMQPPLAAGSLPKRSGKLAVKRYSYPHEPIEVR